MIIDIHLLGYLAKYSPTKQEKFKLELPGEVTVSRLLAEIKFPSDMEKMVLVNGRQANNSTRLADGDEVFIFAPATGG
ncbi:MAG: MoaD/ThiS family protein [Deltaproteobacteria bacterium]|nr:MoaD/ThiS family protein [Deltaproteobacteria bacterium]